MITLKKQYLELLNLVSTSYVRDIYNTISWDERLIGIKGARGVGKTTLLMQRIKLSFPNPEKCLYVSLDDIWFASHTLKDLAFYARENGITHLFLDEIHRMKGWIVQIKNVYDFFPDINVVFTGSSLLEIDNAQGDLSRRCLMYEMPGLSFREYLNLRGKECPKLTLEDVVMNHQNLVSKVLPGVEKLPLFRKYLKHGYYPYYKAERETNYWIRVKNMVTAVIDNDIPAVEDVEYATLLKAKQLLMVMAAQTPSSLNLAATSKLLGTTPNQTVKILDLLIRSQILRGLYYRAERNPKSMQKPRKVLLDNPSILYALGNADKGKVRETFLSSALSYGHELTYPTAGDLLVDGRYLFEVGGAGKGFNQIKDIPGSFVAADDLEFGIGNKIPLWLFGLLY